MKYRYAYTIEAESGGGYTITFPKIAGAVSYADTFDEVSTKTADCLVAGLKGHIALEHDIPAPLKRAGFQFLELSATVAAKVALYEAMRAAGVSDTALARRLGVTKRVVRKMLDLDYRLRVDDLERALSVFGMALDIE